MLHFAKNRARTWRSRQNRVPVSNIADNLHEEVSNKQLQAPGVLEPDVKERAKSTEAKSTEAKSTEAKSTEAKSTEAITTKAERSKNRHGETESLDEEGDQPGGNTGEPSKTKPGNIELSLETMIKGTPKVTLLVSDSAIARTDVNLAVWLNTANGESVKPKLDGPKDRIYSIPSQETENFTFSADVSRDKTELRIYVSTKPKSKIDLAAKSAEIGVVFEGSKRYCRVAGKFENTPRERWINKILGDWRQHGFPDAAKLLETAETHLTDAINVLVNENDKSTILERVSSAKNSSEKCMSDIRRLEEKANGFPDKQKREKEVILSKTKILESAVIPIHASLSDLLERISKERDGEYDIDTGWELRLYAEDDGKAYRTDRTPMLIVPLEFVAKPR